MKEDKIFFSGGQDLCVWNEKGELMDKMELKSEHCKWSIPTNTVPHLLNNLKKWRV